MTYRRQPRIPVTTLSRTLQPEVEVGGDRYPVRNISEGGLGIWVPEPMPAVFKNGATCGFRFHWSKKEVFELEARVRHHGAPRLIGLEFIKITDELRHKLYEMLQPANFAIGMKETQAPTEDPQSGFERSIYESPSGAILTLWVQLGPQVIKRLHLEWNGQFVARTLQEPPEAGFCDGSPFLDNLTGTSAMVKNTNANTASDEDKSKIFEQASQILIALDPPIPSNKLWQFLVSGETTQLLDPKAKVGKKTKAA